MIASNLGLPRSSTYTILGALEEHGYVSYVREERRYGLGLSAFELSYAFSRQEPLARLGTPLLAALVDSVGESAHLAVLHGRDVVYVVEMRAKHRPTLITDVGVRLPSDITASGHAMLYGLPARQLRALFPRPEAFSIVDRGTRTPYLDLREKLTLARQRGFGAEDQSVAPGLASVAVPVTDHLGWPTAAIAVTFERDKFSQGDWPGLAGTIRSYATELSRRIGGRSPIDDDAA
jgi:DNA-binding IclR family transcriptional regulator